MSTFKRLSCLFSLLFFFSTQTFASDDAAKREAAREATEQAKLDSKASKAALAVADLVNKQKAKLSPEALAALRSIPGLLPRGDMPTCDLCGSILRKDGVYDPEKEIWSHTTSCTKRDCKFKPSTYYPSEP